MNTLFFYWQALEKPRAAIDPIYKVALFDMSVASRVICKRLFVYRRHKSRGDLVYATFYNPKLLRFLPLVFFAIYATTNIQQTSFEELLWKHEDNQLFTITIFLFFLFRCRAWPWSIHALRNWTMHWSKNYCIKLSKRTVGGFWLFRTVFHHVVILVFDHGMVARAEIFFVNRFQFFDSICQICNKQRNSYNKM